MLFFATASGKMDLEHVGSSSTNQWSVDDTGGISTCTGVASNGYIVYDLGSKQSIENITVYLNVTGSLNIYGSVYQRSLCYNGNEEGAIDGNMLHVLKCEKKFRFFHVQNVGSNSIGICDIKFYNSEYILLYWSY